MWSLIVLLGICFAQCTAGIHIQRGSYSLNMSNELPSYRTLFEITCIKDFSNNQRSCINDSYLDLSGLNLIKIVDHALDDLPNVKTLNLANNKLDSLPPAIFSRMKKLETLSLAHNRFHWLNVHFSGLNNLKDLNLLDNPVDYLTNLQLVTATASTEITMNLENLMVFNSEYSTDIELCMTNDGAVESVSLLNKNSSENCLKLESQTEDSKDDILDLSAFNLTAFRDDWYKIPDGRFKTISLANNHITEITPQLLNNLPRSISTVDLGDNRITQIERRIMDNRFLKTLTLRSNLISTIEDGAFERTELDTIDLNKNLLTNLNFARTLPTSIRKLVISSNKISEIPADSLGHLKMLQNLLISSNRITRLRAKTFRGLPRLEYLDLSRNSLKTIDAETFDETNKLRISLASNSIFEISMESFKGLKLKEIDLSDNGIAKISRDTLSIMRNSIIDTLDLSGNSIDTIEEGSFANMSIRVLNLNDNNLSEKFIAKRAFEWFTVNNLNLESNLLTGINGDSFYGITVHDSISLKDNGDMKRIAKGFAKYMGCVGQVDFRESPIEYIENGAFSGFRECPYVKIMFSSGTKVIGAGIFDDV